MASEKERTRVFINEPGIFEAATNKKVRLEVNDNQAISSDITVTFPSATGTLPTFQESSTTGSVDFTNVWAADQTSSYQIDQVGNLVTLQIAAIGPATSNASGSIDSTTAIVPAALRPTNRLYFPWSVNDDSATAQWGILTVNTNGTVSLYADAQLNDFAGAAGSTGTQWRMAVTWAITSA